VFEKFGDPLNTLKLRTDLQAPRDDSLSGHQLKVKIIKSPINPSDISFIRGNYNPKARPPLVPGFEGVAVVLNMGNEVKDFKIGDRVAFFSELGGAWQETTIVHDYSCVPVSTNLPLDQAAQLTLNPMTAYGLITQLKIPHGSNEFLLQTAAGSTVGRFVIQLSKILGFKTINLVRREEQVKEIKDLGGDYVYCSSQDFPSKVLEITQGKGVKYAIDCVGGDMIQKMCECMGVGGRILDYGALSGKPNTFDSSLMLQKNLIIEGFHIRFHLASQDGQNTVSSVIKLFETGKLVAPTFREYDVSNFQEAIKDTITPGAHSGKILLSFTKTFEA
jgi:NADPH2:quinone reductase